MRLGRAPALGLHCLGQVKTATLPLDKYGEYYIIRACMQPDDTEHPDALSDARTIDQVGGLPWVEAIGELSAVLDTLFDGPGTPSYIGASKRAEDVAFEYLPPHGTVRLFTRQFWGSSGESVVAGFCEKAQRPALMSIIAVDLDIPGARNLTYVQATSMALDAARVRSVDL
jgi:hypothetical protein